MRRSIAIMAVFSLAALACGDDDNGAADAGAAAADGSAEDAAADDTAACDAWVAATRAIDIDEDLEAGIAALEDVVATAPDDVAAAVEPVIPLLREDPAAALESEEALAADRAADDWSLDACGEARIDLEAVNFAFAGVPSEVDAGRVAFDLTNGTQTDEFHEALLLRENDDVAESPHDALAAGLGDTVSAAGTMAALEPFTLVGIGFVEPAGGDTEDVFVADLEPGEYIVACLLPADSADLVERYFAGEEIDGMRHFDHGMFAEFTVS